MSEEHFLELINTHKRTIYNLLNLYVQDLDEIEDLKQEIILQSWKSKDSFLNQSSFNTWLYKVSLFTILTFKKKQPTLNRVDLKEAHSIHQEENFQSDQAESLQNWIARLDDLSKTIITMHLDGFSNSEIADFIGIKLNNLNVKLHRIKEKAVLNLKRSQWD